VEREAIVGGVLVSASFLLAVMFNRSAIEQTPTLAPVPSIQQRAVPDPRDLTPARLAHLDRSDLSPMTPVLQGEASTVPSELVDGRRQWLVFPANVQCGSSLADAGEAIVLDYNVSESLQSHHDTPDALGRDGLQLREELREVRAGLYLGRAYSGSSLLLDFVLYEDATLRADAAQPEQVRDECGARAARHDH